MNNFKIEDFDVVKFDEILGRGLSLGLGEQGGQVCIEAAVCEVLGLTHSDDPQCITQAVRNFKLILNDSKWSSPEVRAKSLRDLGLAQLGSLGVVNGEEFDKRMAEKTIRVILPKLFRELWPEDEKMLAVALRCEQEGTKEAAKAAAKAAFSFPSSAFSFAVTCCNDRAAAWAAGDAAGTAANSDEYLNLSAQLALETLRELESPGIKFLREAE